MVNGYDIAYYAGLGIGWPLWAIRSKTRAKVKDAFETRMAQGLKSRRGNGPAVLIHAVSVGELNAARGLIEQLQAARPELHVIVTTTTITGDEQARNRYGNRADMTVLRSPLDLSPAIERMLDALRPTLVVLMELEVWPNFLRHCERRQIPVVIANGRITEPSFRRYRLLGPLAGAMFRRLTWCIAQDEVYGERFRALGVPPERLVVAGTVKFDTATIGETVPGADELARDLDLPLPLTDGAEASQTKPPLLVAGSTGPGEEEIVLDVYARLLQTHPTLRLAIVPRKPERFDEVATLIASRGYACLRRSSGPHPGPLPGGEGVTSVVLGDTMGELRKFYALADVVFVGRTLVDLGVKQHGSDMIEPAALGCPVVVGPFTGNFDEPMRAFRSQDAIVEVATADEFFSALDRLLADPVAAVEMGTKAQQVVLAGKGAVKRHVELFLPLLQ